MSKDTTPATPASTTPPATPAPVKATRKAGIDLEAFPSEAAALDAVKDRVKGHRRVFNTKTKDGKSETFVASHPAYVGQFLFQRDGGTIVEAGKAARAPRGAAAPIASMESAIEAMKNSALPQAEKDKVIAELTKIMGGAKPAPAKK
jgi:hypothetical protein